MNVHLVQFDISWEDREANHKRVSSMLEAQKPSPGSLIVLPEMFSTGFSMNISATTQTEAREDEAFLAELARSHGCCVMGGVVSPPFNPPDKLKQSASTPQMRARNESVTFSAEGTLLARYVKMQPFMLGGEGDCYTAGDAIVTFPCNGFTVAPLICYDLRFPELFRSAVKLGADLMVVIASWPVKRYHHWLTLLQARAIENLSYVIGVNRCGSDPNLHYNGRSVVVSPHGHIIADAGEGEGIISARIDAAEVGQWRAQFPALRDMR